MHRVLAAKEIMLLARSTYLNIQLRYAQMGMMIIALPLALEVCTGSR